MSVEREHRTGDPPRPTGRVAEVQITGALFPWAEGRPVILGIEGSEDYCLPLFTRPELLEATMVRTGIPYESIKQVEDGAAFLASLPETFGGCPLRLIQDLRFLENGRVRYLQVFPESIVKEIADSHD